MQMYEAFANATSSMQNISTFMLIDTGAPKSICSEQWINELKWTPILTKPLPVTTKPFRFAGHPVLPKHIACLIAKVTDINGNTHLLRQVVFILPSTPIPFLLGLQTHRSLGFDLCLRVQNGSHLRVNSWNTIIPLSVSSHLWLKFQPVNSDPLPNFDWQPLIDNALENSPTDSHFLFPVSYPTPPQGIVHHNNEDADKNCYPIPPWKRDDWTSALTGNSIDKIHKTLRHPEPTSMMQLFRQQNSQRKLPASLKAEIEDHTCKICEEHAQLPRVPKISIPPPASPNLAVTLDVMQHNILGKPVKILVMLDAGDVMLRLKHIPTDSARNAFSAYFTRWISIFDSPVFTIVDRGRNLTNDYMVSQLHLLQSQLCPIPTEAPWSIGTNERSHGFLHRAIDKLQESQFLDCSNDVDVLLSEVEMSWNFVQHVNNVLPHYQRFGDMPRQLGNREIAPTTRERIALMELARQHTEQLRAEHTILRALNTRYRHVTDLKLFKVDDPVWFHRNKHGWRRGIVVRVDRPTIHVEHLGKLYPTHENRTRPFFGDTFVPPELKNDDDSSHGIIYKPSETYQPQIEPQPASEVSGIPISDLINGIFSVSHPPSLSSSVITTDDNLLMMLVESSPCGVIDSQFIFHTEVEYVKNLKDRSEIDKAEFKKSKDEEIKFLLKGTVKPIPTQDRNPDCEIQPLKWVLAIKRSSNSKPPVRYRARLVSASNRTELRHSVHGNAPTVGMHTIRILMAIFPTWFKIAKRNGKKLVFFTRDVTKAFLQSNPSQRLIYYRPPQEFYEKNKNAQGMIWLGKTQLYGDVEAGLYWNRTFISWLCANILDITHSLYDPSLLYSPSTTTAMLLCTDDTGVVMNEEDLSIEEKVTKRFTCRERQFPPVDFKGIEVHQINESITISQTEYSDKMTTSSLSELYPTKEEKARPINDEEVKVIRSDAGKLA